MPKLVVAGTGELRFKETEDLISVRLCVSVTL